MNSETRLALARRLNLRLAVKLSSFEVPFTSAMMAATDRQAVASSVAHKNSAMSATRTITSFSGSMPNQHKPGP